MAVDEAADRALAAQLLVLAAKVTASGQLPANTLQRKHLLAQVGGQCCSAGRLDGTQLLHSCAAPLGVALGGLTPSLSHCSFLIEAAKYFFRTDSSK